MPKLISAWTRLPVLLVILITLVMASPALAWSQAAIEPNPEVVRGGRIRLLVPSYDQEFITGRVLMLTADSLAIESVGTDTLRFANTMVQQAQISVGFSRGESILRGAGRGMLIGGVLTGTLVLLGMADFCIYISCLRHDLAGAAGGFVLGLLPGAALGALVGGGGQVEQWRRVELIRLRRG